MQLVYRANDWFIMQQKGDEIEFIPLDKEKVYFLKDETINKRTLQQNRALHLYCKQVAEALNSAGYDMKKVIKADVQWTQLQVKELIWKPIQKALLNKESTTKLKKNELDLVYTTVAKLLAEKFGIDVEFPNKGDIDV